MSSTLKRAGLAYEIGGGISLVGAFVVHSLWGFPSLLLFLAGAVLCLVISLMWSSLQGMGEGDEMSFEEALSFSAPTATEEQKRAVLRTLKDLDYELHVGKISQEDFDEVSREVRHRAKLLIAQQDEDMEGRIQKAQDRLEDFKKAAAEKESEKEEDKEESKS